MSRPDKPARRLGHNAYLVKVSPSGKAALVSVESAATRVGPDGPVPIGRVELWVPISQIHSDSEVYGVGVEGDRQLSGSVGSLIVSDWWCNQPDNATTIEEHAITSVAYTPGGGE